MPKIEGFRVKNYRVLKDVTLGKLWNTPQANALTSLTAVIGKNGVGKSSLFDAFGFLADCLKLGVEEACDTRGRGGFDRIRSQGEDGPIEFVLYYRQAPSARPITYELAIARDGGGRPCVARERLRQRRKGQRHGQPFSFLQLEGGEGGAWSGGWRDWPLDQDETVGNLLQRIRLGEEGPETKRVELEDKRRLGIATLGALADHPRIASFRAFVEGWYLSYFTPDAARGLPLAGPQRHLSERGDNLGNVVQFMERDHPKRFQRVLLDIAEKIPGINRIDTTRSPDGRLLLRFNDRGFQDPFFAAQMSDGTLKIFAYLLLLNDPRPSPFICMEEPENGVYHKLLDVFVAELRRATRAPNASQIFVTTHQPYFVNALAPEETWIMEKQTDGFAKVTRASEDDTVVELAREGLPLGDLWHSEYLDR